MVGTSTHLHPWPDSFSGLGQVEQGHSPGAHFSLGPQVHLPGHAQEVLRFEFLHSPSAQVQEPEGQEQPPPHLEPEPELYVRGVLKKGLRKGRSTNVTLRLRSDRRTRKLASLDRLHGPMAHFAFLVDLHSTLTSSCSRHTCSCRECTCS